MKLCDLCGKAVREENIYLRDNKAMCEECAMMTGLFPLGHTGVRRDKISEKGRQLTVPSLERRVR